VFTSHLSPPCARDLIVSELRDLYRIIWGLHVASGARDMRLGDSTDDGTDASAAADTEKLAPPVAPVALLPLDIKAVKYIC